MYVYIHFVVWPPRPRVEPTPHSVVLKKLGLKHLEKLRASKQTRGTILHNEDLIYIHTYPNINNSPADNTYG